MQTGSSWTLIGWKSGQTTFVPLCDRMERAWLRTLVRAANGDADQIRSANYKPYLISRIFFLFGPLLFLRSEHSVRK
jgi:hypothetical protein